MFAVLKAYLNVIDKEVNVDNSIVLCVKQRPKSHCQIKISKEFKNIFEILDNISFIGLAPSHATIQKMQLVT